MPANPAFTKRQKELARQEHQRDKAARKEQRKRDQDARGTAANGEDPDIAGIVPGPQPIADED